MSVNTLAILKTYGQIGVDLLKQSIQPLSASDKTVQSVKYKVTDNKTSQSLQITARKYVQKLESGVPPTSKGVSSEMIDSLKEYAKARGMEDPEKAAWALAKSIQKKGDKTYQRGGREVYSDSMKKLSDELQKEIVKDQTKFVINEIKLAFK